jgi:ABC-type uncharacterized transport system substrate-binding protein
VRRRDFMTVLASAAAYPLAPRAQQKAMPVVGLLISVGATKPQFGQGLNETGYKEGRDVALDYRYVDYDQLAAVAADFVRRKVAVIAAFGPAAALAAKHATATIPIVFSSGDPVVEGLVASLARPGGNLTGVSLINAELMPKRLELLSELVPQARAFALLINPEAETAEAVIRQTRDAAHTRGVELLVVKTSNSFGAIDSAFAALQRRHVDALVVDPASFPGPMYIYPVTLAAQYAIPAIYGSSLLSWAGGLISYGPNTAAAYRQMGIYAGRILKGARPADLPVWQPDRFELVINLKTAKALGLTVPQTLLARADTVIE